MEYQVPQFIEVESKIVGPFTLRQFIYIAGGVGLCLALLRYLPLLVAIPLCIPVAGFAGALAFYKINNKPFINTVEAAAKFYTSAHLFLWRKEEQSHPKAAAKPAAPAGETPRAHNVRLTRGKLQELASSLDVHNQPNTNVPQNNP